MLIRVILRVLPSLKAAKYRVITSEREDEGVIVTVVIDVIIAGIGLLGHPTGRIMSTNYPRV